MVSIYSKRNIGEQFYKWLVDTYVHGNDFHFVRPRIICRDGFSMSVQGGSYSYSNPRDFGTVYNEMEIGFPSDEEILLSDYKEGDNLDVRSVFGYVPVEVIIQIIKKHGGFKKII